jgi:hypothetical protein
MFLLTIVGLAFWRRRRTARTRAEAALNHVAVIYNPNHGPEEAAVVINLPIRRSFRAAHAPIRYPEGVAGL